MSTALFLLVPIGILAVVWLLCFVGCHFPTTGEAQPYSDQILNDSDTTQFLVAYWPMADLIGPQGGALAPCADISGNNRSGAYLIPPGYPSGIQFSKAITSPTLNVRQGSIVPGDAGSSKNPSPASVDFEGGFVNIPWNTFNPLPPQLDSFTFEAWIQPILKGTDANGMFRWVVFSAVSSDFTGFVIYLDESNGWNVMLGNGSAFQQVLPLGPTVPANLQGGDYLAVTFDNTTSPPTFNLFINPDSDDPSTPPAANFTTTTATYVAVDPTTQQVPFFMGAGDNNDAQNLRTVAGGSGAPLVPFQGKIQSVALYSSAIGASDLANHFADGAAS